MTDIREETNQQAATNEVAGDEAAQAGAANDSQQDTFGLPTGSTVLRITLEKKGDNDYGLNIEGILVGTEQFDPSNPCHRFLAIIADKLPELMDGMGHAKVEHVPSPAVAANDATVGDDAAAG